MHSLDLFSWFRSITEDWSWAWLWLLFIGILINAVSTSKPLLDEMKESTGSARNKAVCKLVFDWSLVLLSLIGALSSQWSSETSDAKIRRQASDIERMDESLKKTHSEQVTTKSNQSVTAQQIADFKRRRTISKEQESEFAGFFLANPHIQKAKVSIITGTQNDETFAYTHRLREMLDAAGFAANEGLGIVLHAGAFAPIASGYVKDGNGMPTNLVGVTRGLMGKPTSRIASEGPNTFIVVKTMDSLLAGALVTAFAMAEIESPIISSDSLQPGEVAVFVADRRY